jgi:predicted ATPase
MLLRFRFGNHGSVNEEQELSLVASSLKDDDRGLIGLPSAGLSVVPAAVIYGANASGKSTILDAFRYFRFMVRSSHTRENPGSSLPRQVHMLDPAAASKSSGFEVDFLHEGVRYNYGFAVSKYAIEDEWLMAYPRERPQHLFSRRKQKFKFSRLLKGRNQLISELTRPDSLFVSAGAQNDHEVLSIVSKYVNSWRVNDPTMGGFGSWTPDKVDRRVIEFLSRIGTGVVSYQRKKLKPPPGSEAFIKDFRRVLARHFKDQRTTEQIVMDAPTSVLELGHRAKDGRDIYFALEAESDGTRRLLVLLSTAFEALEKGTLLLVDELDASLHTHACEEVVSLFSNKKINKNGAQLIATTHDTNLMKSDVLRRDQLWFVSKDASGASRLYPLTDIRTRRGDNIEKGYLEGRFGAIPHQP